MRESLRRYIDGGIQALEGYANLAGRSRNLTQRAGSNAGSASRS